MNTPTQNQNFRQRRNNFKKGGGRQDFRRGNGGGQHFNTNTHQSNNSHHARHPELDIVIDGKAAKRASTMRDKYQSMARDAQNNGDRVYAEYCNQHVDHYNRILNAYNESRPQHLRQNEGAEAGSDDTGVEQAAAGEVVAIQPTANPPAEDDSYQAAGNA